jgi:16S rRNA processing protein RimM
MTSPPDRRVAVGRVAGFFGIRGWVKVYSYTRPREAILSYSPWLVELGGTWRELEVAEGQVHGKGIVARITGVGDRDQAAQLLGAEIAVAMSRFPATAANEYYWADLEGLRVVNLLGQELGHVDHLFETGANDVLVTRGERERLIPFTKNAIQRVDLASGVIHVDWDFED